MADPPARKRPCNHQKFDSATKKLRQALIESLADLYEAHVAENSGKCRRNFVKGLVEKDAATTIGLNITRHDVDNACCRRRAQSTIAATPAPAIAPAAGGSALDTLAGICSAVA